MNYGIDYSCGAKDVNRDPENGIRFGVISIHEVTQAWCEDAEPIYPEVDVDENDPEYDYIMDQIEASAWVYNEDGYRCTQNVDDCDIFVECSPFFTYAEFCSPCAPGAVYLKNPIIPENVPSDASGVDLDNNKGYCLGHAWFVDGKAPYPVYSVETGKLVEPKS